MFYLTCQAQIELPVNCPDRKNLDYLKITDIGNFGLWRKDRPKVPGHFHTGIDIKRPGNNYVNNPVFPVAEGIVISIRDDGPYAQLIVEHELKNLKFWSVYEHIAEIKIDLGDHVNILHPIARFMTREELNKYGWQFDHFHLEILKVKPSLLAYDAKLPKRLYSSYSLICYTTGQLNYYYYNPLDFFQRKLGAP